MLAPAVGIVPPLTGLLRRALHLVIPVACASCGTDLTDDPIPFFCRTCWAGLTPLAGPRCPRCGRPFGSPSSLAYAPRHRCGSCRRRPPAYSMAWSLYPYVSPLSDAIRLFKYQRKVILADALGALMRYAADPVPQADCLMPVPLHVGRLREREFNQSLLLADRLNRRLRLPLSYDNLIRLRPTEPQTELSRKARLKNLRSAFGLARPGAVWGQRVLLVDDVFTTGTTLNECAKVLRKAGAKEVYALTLARTL